ncbi:hypothetical protein BR93DRAFT_605858 [Coniochaeta sp. PMI_546]|nr:hypothetical protein BR93DRAFT_605858 [Coniochaeta sp. PMI_546]
MITMICKDTVADKHQQRALYKAGSSQLPPPENKRKIVTRPTVEHIGYGVAVTSMTLTHQPGVRLPVSENFFAVLQSALLDYCVPFADLKNKNLSRCSPNLYG